MAVFDKRNVAKIAKANCQTSHRELQSFSHLFDIGLLGDCCCRILVLHVNVNCRSFLSNRWHTHINFRDIPGTRKNATERLRSIGTFKSGINYPLKRNKDEDICQNGAGTMNARTNELMNESREEDLRKEVCMHE